MAQFESLLPDHAQPILLMCNVEYAHATGKEEGNELPIIHREFCHCV